MRQRAGTVLVGDRKTLEFRNGGLEFLADSEVKGIEAAARQQEHLVEAHAARGTQLTLKAHALTQQTRLRIATAFGRAGKFHDNERQVSQIGLERLLVVGWQQAHRQLCARHRAFAPRTYGQIVGQRQHNARRARRLFLADIGPVVGDDLTVLNDLPHTHAH